MVSLNCSSCGGSSTSFKGKLMGNASANKTMKKANAAPNFKGQLNCSACGSANKNLGNKFNKTV